MGMTTLRELAEALNAYEGVDVSDFQRRARVLQALWRKHKGYPIGLVPGKGASRKSGSRLEMPWAKETLANFLTDKIKDVVQREVIKRDRTSGQLYEEDRLFGNLLSSQPLCFNLFAELQQDLPLATAVLKSMLPCRIGTVTEILFEHSPARGGAMYTGDHSAHDVFIKYETLGARTGFLGVEVKYHENLLNPPSKHKPRYDEVAKEMGCFCPERLADLKRKPLQQIWRDHLLAGSMVTAGDYNEGAFVFLYAKDNPHCAAAVTDYRSCLTNDSTFIAWTLEDFCAAVRTHTDAAWIVELVGRYLDFAKVDAALEMDGQRSQ